MGFNYMAVLMGLFPFTTIQMLPKLLLMRNYLRRKQEHPLPHKVPFRSLRPSQRATTPTSTGAAMLGNSHISIHILVFIEPAPVHRWVWASTNPSTQ